MARMLKVYDAEARQIAATAGARVIESYAAFLLVEASDEAKAALAKGHLIEDITDQFPITVNDQAIDTSVPRVTTAGATSPHPAYKRGAKLSAGPHHYIVQFLGPIKEQWLTQARKAGADIVAPYEGFSVIARLTPKAVEAVAKLPTVRWLGHLPYSARLSRRILRQDNPTAPDPDEGTPRSRYFEATFTVQFFRSDLAASARATVKRLGFSILDYTRGSETMVVRCTSNSAKTARSRIDKLSRVHGVRRIRARAMRRPSNDQAAVIMGSAAALGVAPALGLSGAGEVIGVCDTGLDNGNPATIHPDFNKRILAIKSYPVAPEWKDSASNVGADDGPADLDSGHGTHTSGSVLGDGTASSLLPGLAGPVRGLSYRAKLVFQAVEQEIKWKKPADLKQNGRFMLAGLPSDLRPLFSFAYGKGARIHSNSWGGGDPKSYDEMAYQVDDFVWSKQDFCVLFAAGNDGTDHNSDGAIDLGSITPPGTAKNCITVGASENNRPQIALTYGSGWPTDYPVPPISVDRLANNPNDIAAFSSRGPTQDGRIKPDVVAPGTYVLSTRSRSIASNNFGYGKFGSTKLYMFDSGTSMATPLAAGAVGVIREYLRKTVKIASPSAALLKAALIAGAESVRGGTPAPDNNEGFGRINLDKVLAPQAPLKAMFVEGAGLSTGALKSVAISVKQGGLPLKVVLCYSDYPGPKLVNNLNLIVRSPGNVAFVGNGAGTSFDSTNNVERVVVPQAAAGAYQLQVVGSNVPQGPQPFALAVIGAL
jgi:hypothetical protein